MTEQLSWREIILKGHRTFPHVPWAARGRWQPSLSTFAILIGGLSLFGFGEGLLFVAHNGNSPWVVLSEGISARSGLSVGVVTALVSISVLTLWIPLKEKPGLGTVMNIIVIAAVLEITIDHLPAITNHVAAVAADIAAVLAIGLGSAFYLTTKLGPGPRDGLMTSLHNRTGVRVSRVRLSIELTVLAIGWLLGGTVGLGTLLFAGGIGRAIALWLGVLSRLAPAD
jgi:uncharacterized membrane protein YczE